MRKPGILLGVLLLAVAVLPFFTNAMVFPASNWDFLDEVKALTKFSPDVMTWNIATYNSGSKDLIVFVSFHAGSRPSQYEWEIDVFNLYKSSLRIVALHKSGRFAVFSCGIAFRKNNRGTFNFWVTAVSVRWVAEAEAEKLAAPLLRSLLDNPMDTLAASRWAAMEYYDKI